MRALLHPLIAAAWLLGAPAPAAASAPRQPLVDDEQLVGRVLNLADERLALMPAVAAAKWPRHLPVSDPAREAVVTHSAGEHARQVGLKPAPVEQFLVLQIRLAKSVEERLFARWDATGDDFPGKSPDLTQELRPQLDRLADASIAALYLAAPAFGRPDFVPWAKELARRRLPAARWSEADRDELVAALAEVRWVSAASVSRSRAAGVLRIGTPGDYAPFSTSVDGAVTGADIELAEALGDSLGLRTVFVRSSWRTLLADLAADRFDVAVGGISVTPARSAVADFSPPTTRSGKTAIGRCTDAARLGRFEAINVPTVSVVFNPGGTNETFARAHLKFARLVEHDDNRTVFDEILGGRADVMFTDETEIALATHQHPQLCRLLQESFEPADKAFLMPRASGWTDVVNPWMDRALHDGVPARLLREYLDR